MEVIIEGDFEGVSRLGRLSKTALTMHIEWNQGKIEIAKVIQEGYNVTVTASAYDNPEGNGIPCKMEYHFTVGEDYGEIKLASAVKISN